jgi:hypothetical protein
MIHASKLFRTLASSFSIHTKINVIFLKDVLSCTIQDSTAKGASIFPTSSAVKADVLLLLMPGSREYKDRMAYLFRL